MHRITSILAVVEGVATGGTVLAKARALADLFHARVDLLITDPALMPAFARQCATPGHERVVLCSDVRTPEPLHERLLRRLHERQPDLLVKAPMPRGAHDGALPDGDEWLARESPVPVALVGPMPWRTQHLHFAAAVDLSDPDSAAAARNALQAAGFLALGSQGDLDVLYSERESTDSVLRMERAVRLAQLVRDFRLDCGHLKLLEGAPEERLPPLLAERVYDVLVLGTAGPRGSAALRHLAARLSAATPGDVLLVRPPEPALSLARPGFASTREQVAHQLE